MRICFVRHGHPNYEKDCLTELGHKQAAAAAERLAPWGFETIYASSQGRAMQTAEYTAKKLGLPVIPCDFMREIGWGSLTDEALPCNAQPWDVSAMYIKEGKSLCDLDWTTKYPYENSGTRKHAERVIDGLDAWLLTLGYQREGDYYRVIGENTGRTVAMFSHAGASSVALSHMLNLPFPQLCGSWFIELTALTVVDIPNTKGALVYPRLCLFNDAAHLQGVAAAPVCGS